MFDRGAIGIQLYIFNYLVTITGLANWWGWDRRQTGCAHSGWSIAVPGNDDVHPSDNDAFDLS